MRFWERLFGQSKRSISYGKALECGFIDAPTKSGVQVNEKTAMGLSALWCGLRVLSGDVGSLAPILHRESEDGRTREPATSHPIYSMLTESPNPETTRPVFFETLQLHALLGNGLAEIERNGAGQPVNLWPIHPGNVQFARGSQGQQTYIVSTDIGQVTLDAADVLHVPGLSPDGSIGYSLLKIARESLGFGLAAQRYGAAFFGNAARPSGTLEVQGELSEQARENLRRSWATLYTGTDNTGKVAILEEGLTFKPIMLTNEQSQYKELLNWFTYEVARFLNITPTKLHSLEKATWANLTELNRDYLTTSLRPWLIKWEAELERKLLTPEERATHYIEFDTASLLRVDQKTQAEIWKIGNPNGQWYTDDEIRVALNLGPMPKVNNGKDTTPQSPVNQPATTGNSDTTPTGRDTRQAIKTGERWKREH